ncbi:MAG: hypothetical protein J6386_04910 [Candidatus Synoicihabitans palmerolidicus]|nr:hypothetical protein [Candidatus Synoicihabitans palmerolidicus]
MGLGDLALFAALPHLGARLTILMCQCLAVPVAMLTEWLWLDTGLRVAEIVWSSTILGGLVLALMPSRHHPPKVPLRPLGFIMGALAAIGQGLGAVISRHGYELTTAAGTDMDGISAAYQRISGGLIITACYFIALQWRSRSVPAKPSLLVSPEPRHRAWAYLMGNAFCGPIIGVSCYQ